MVEKFGMVHLSAGDLLRAERNRSGSEYGELIQNYIKDGLIVPIAITCKLIENAMNKRHDIITSLLRYYYFSFTLAFKTLTAKRMYF